MKGDGRERESERTSLGDSDEISILQTDGDGLTLNGTRSLVSDGLDDVEDGKRDLGLGPRTHREGNGSTCEKEKREDEFEISKKRARVYSRREKYEPRAAILKSSLKIRQSRSFISSRGLSLQCRSSVPDLFADRRSRASAYLRVSNKTRSAWRTQRILGEEKEKED